MELEGAVSPRGSLTLPLDYTELSCSHAQRHIPDPGGGKSWHWAKAATHLLGLEDLGNAYTDIASCSSHSVISGVKFDKDIAIKQRRGLSHKIVTQSSSELDLLVLGFIAY